MMIYDKLLLVCFCDKVKRALAGKRKEDEQEEEEEEKEEEEKDVFIPISRFSLFFSHEQTVQPLKQYE